MVNMEDAEIIEKELLVDSFKKVVRERIKFADDDIQDWVYLDTPKSYVIIALTKDKELVLVKLYRHNIKQNVYELPAGGAEQTGETVAEAAQRELREETGYTATNVIDLGAYYVLPSETNRWVHYFLALNAAKVEEPKYDKVIEKYFNMSVHLVPFSEVQTIKGAAKHGVSGLEALFGISLAKEYLETAPNE